MYISEFSPTPGTELDLTALVTFGFTISPDEIYAGFLIDRVLRRLDEADPETPKHWSRDELLLWLDDAITEFNLITGYLNQTVSVDWSQTENVLDLPGDTVAPIEVIYGNTVLKKYSLEGFDSKFQWEDGKTGVRPLGWAPIGTTKIVVYPLAPSSGKTLSVVTLYQPDPAVERGTDIEVPDQYHDAIEHYMFARARFKEGGKEFLQADKDYERFYDQADEWGIRTDEQRRTMWKNRFNVKPSYDSLKDKEHS